MHLPDLQDTNLDPPTADTLFADLASCTQVLSIVPKPASGFAANKSISLPAARTGLRDGSFRAVQIRYRFEGREWCDTLMATTGGGMRLVRICTDEALASTQHA